jgi:NAD(P)H-dependent FMN reductase
MTEPVAEPAAEPAARDGAGAAPRVLVVAGSMRVKSRTRVLCTLAYEAVRAAGGDARLVDLREVKLPVYEIDSLAQAELAIVEAAREAARWADAFLLASPEYHGGISGALKNWLDFLYTELAGKLVGVLTVTGGDHGGDLSARAIVHSANSLHAFTLPTSSWRAAATGPTSSCATK